MEKTIEQQNLELIKKIRDLQQEILEKVKARTPEKIV